MSKRMSMKNYRKRVNCTADEIQKALDVSNEHDSLLRSDMRLLCDYLEISYCGV